MKEADDGGTEETRVILARAASAVRKALRGREFLGKTAWDYALDAWIYNEERGVSHDFTSRRAKFLVIEDIRVWYGRDTNPKKKNKRSKPKTISLNSDSPLLKTAPCRPTRKDELELSHIDHDKFRFICECLAEGKPRQYAANVMGISSTRVGQIIEAEKWRLGYDNQ